MSTCGFYGDNETETEKTPGACIVCKKTLPYSQIVVSHQGDSYCAKHFNSVWRPWNRKQLQMFFSK